MRTPQRKPGKFANIQKDHHITLQKKQNLEAELYKLKNVQRPYMIIEVDTLAQMGDFSENAGYQIAKGKLRRINYRILEIEDFLKFAILIDDTKSINTIKLGHYVTVDIAGTIMTFQILGSSETNPSTGIISHRSALGQALLGQKINDTITIKVNNKKILYKVIKISNQN